MDCNSHWSRILVALLIVAGAEPTRVDARPDDDSRLDLWSLRPLERPGVPAGASGGAETTGMTVRVMTFQSSVTVMGETG